MHDCANKRGVALVCVAPHSSAAVREEAPRSSPAKMAHPLAILYGSETGTAQVRRRDREGRSLAADSPARDCHQASPVRTPHKHTEHRAARLWHTKAIASKVPPLTFKYSVPVPSLPTLLAICVYSCVPGDHRPPQATRPVAPLCTAGRAVSCL